MANHVHSIVVGIAIRAQFMDRVNNMMWPRFWKDCTNHVVKLIGQVTIQCVEAMLEEFNLESLLINWFVVAHDPNNLLDIVGSE